MKEWTLILFRSFALFFLTLIIMRILGKRNIARMTPFNFATYIAIAVTATLISLNVITNLAFGLITLGVWFLFSMLLDLLSMKSKSIHDLVNGKETILIKHGKIMEENLVRARLTGQELLRELRSKNAFNLADVEFAVMEATGDINVLMKSDKKPVTPHDLGQKVAPQSESQTVILDGNILNESLATIGLNQGWLQQQLEVMGITLDNVFIGQVDSSGDLYVDLFNDSIQITQPKVKELLYANLQKSHADLMTYSMEVEDNNIKEMYSKNADKLKNLLEKLEPYLLR